jgi:curved DNA-binding protein CbpA
MTADPYRTLGLQPGASIAEVKRAYRSLAKANHPDSAGERALPRFLAIQAAYEQLTSATRPGGRTRTASRTSEPWRADPGRAREARERERPPGAERGGGPRGRSETGGSASTRGPGNRAAGSTTGRGDGGSAGTRSGQGTGSPGSAGARRNPGSAGPSAAGSRRPGTRPGGAPGTSERARGGTSRRATRKATFGSTTYDEVREPVDPTWQGASWYGPSSGEYWTVNPREYADPRKHGPEYQARAAERYARSQARADERARRAAAGAPDGDRARRPDGRPVPGGSGDDGARRAGHATASAAHDAEATGRERAATDSPAAGSPRPRSAAGADHATGRRAVGGAAPGPGRAASWASAKRVRGSGASAPGSVSPGIERPGPADGGGPPGLDLRLDLDRLESLPFRRWLAAFAAWPPLGIAAAAVIGDLTGCAGFDATCTTDATFYPWLAQLVILGALFALPAASRLLVGGTVAVAVMALPVAAALSASGATYDPTYGPPALIALLAIAWLGGVALAALRVTRMRGGG